MFGREKPGDIEKCLGYVSLYTKKWLIIASRKAFWWEAGWSALFCVSLAVRGRRRAQKTPKIAPAREEYPPGHWEKKAESCKVVEPEDKEGVKAPEGEDYEWLS